MLSVDSYFNAKEYLFQGCRVLSPVQMGFNEFQSKKLA